MDLDLPLLHHDLVDQRRDKALTSLRSQSSEAPKGPLPAVPQDRLMTGFLGRADSRLLPGLPTRCPLRRLARLTLPGVT